MHRSYLFAPGHNAKLLRRVFEAGADAVILDLEDAVPPDAKEQARVMVAGVLAERSAWVRINTVRTDLAAADLAAVAGLAAGIRIPKAESADDVQWVHDRAPGSPRRRSRPHPVSGTCPWAASTCEQTWAPATATCRLCTRARTSWWPRARP